MPISTVLPARANIVGISQPCMLVSAYGCVSRQSLMRSQKMAANSSHAWFLKYGLSGNAPVGCHVPWHFLTALCLIQVVQRFVLATSKAVSQRFSPHSQLDRLIECIVWLWTDLLRPEAWSIYGKREGWRVSGVKHTCRNC